MVHQNVTIENISISRVFIILMLIKMLSQVNLYKRKSKKKNIFMSSGFHLYVTRSNKRLSKKENGLISRQFSQVSRKKNRFFFSYYHPLLERESEKYRENFL